MDHDARTVTVPAKGGKRATVAFEDVRLALPDESFEPLVQSAIDAVDDIIDDAIDNNPSQWFMPSAMIAIIFQVKITKMPTSLNVVIIPHQLMKI